VSSFLSQRPSSPCRSFRPPVSKLVSPERGSGGALIQALHALDRGLRLCPPVWIPGFVQHGCLRYRFATPIPVTSPEVVGGGDDFAVCGGRSDVSVPEPDVTGPGVHCT
jgi:hypothetical protein